MLKFIDVIKMQEILDLSMEEKISMVGDIWDSIDHNPITLPRLHEQELEPAVSAL